MRIATALGANALLRRNDPMTTEVSAQQRRGQGGGGVGGRLERGG